MKFFLPLLFVILTLVATLKNKAAAQENDPPPIRSRPGTAERPARPERPGRPGRPGRPDRPEILGLPERPQMPERPERLERLERPERPEILGLPERPQRPQMQERLESPERPRRPERRGRTERRRRPEGPERRDERRRPARPGIRRQKPRRSENQARNNRCKRPDPKGIDHFADSEHHYWLSWRSSDLDNAQKTWFEADKVCKSFCMALVSIESQEEHEHLAKQVADGNIYGSWTGGRQCRAEGCQDPEGQVQWVFEPIRKLFKNLGFEAWSESGRLDAQPDNLTGQEKCVAVLNDWYDDGVAWHDIECEDRMPFICEDV